MTLDITKSKVQLYVPRELVTDRDHNGINFIFTTDVISSIAPLEITF